MLAGTHWFNVAMHKFGLRPDDHEILNDVWGAGTPGLRDRRAVFRDIGVRAWYDYLAWSNPTDFQQRVHFGKATLKKGSNILVDLEADFTRLDLKISFSIKSNRPDIRPGSSAV